MEVLKRLPNSLELNPSSSLSGEGDELFLSVSCNHTVSAKLSGELRDATGCVSYVMHTNKSHKVLCDKLNISKSVSPLVMQSSEDVKAIIDSVRPKTGYDLSAFVGQYFDMRALAYALGAVFSACSWGTMNNVVPPEIPCARSITNVWRNPNSGDILLPPTFTDSASEWVSFCCIAAWAKAKAVVYLSDTVPPGGNVFVGAAMASFALKVYAWVLAAADSLCVADHHEEAFFRGMCSVIKLHGHSDEAGWIREALATADYPRPQGMLFTVAASKIGLATDSRVANNEVLRWNVALMLKYAAVYSAVDDSGSKLPTIFKVNEGDGRPSDVDGIYNIYEHMSRWRTAIGKMGGHMPSSVGDVSSFRTYFTNDAVDRHFKPNTYMCPYFWVEPSMIISGEAVGSWQPCDPEKTTILPLFDSVLGTSKRPHYKEVNGMPLKGQEVLFKVAEYIPRRNGASYLLAGSYDRRDGLAQFSTVVEPRMGTLYKDLAHANPDATDLAGARWNTPHNPLPHPLEGFTTLPATIRYTTRGVRHMPNLADISGACQVVSECGPLFVSSAIGQRLRSVSSYVPPHLRVTMEMYRRDGITSVEDEEWIFEGLPICGPDPGMVTVTRAADIIEAQEEDVGGTARGARWSRTPQEIVESHDVRVVGTVDMLAPEHLRVTRDKVATPDASGVKVAVPPDNDPGSQQVVPKSDPKAVLNKNGSE